jgi:hypothetical protein
MFVSCAINSPAVAESLVPTASAPQWPSTYFVLALEENLKATTDAGRDIPLFNYELILVPEAPEQRNFDPRHNQLEFLLTLERQYLASIDQDIRKLARTGEPFPGSNCHGWVFTGGRFGIQDAHVATILKENRYSIVSDAQEGDLAIYRVNGRIKHTGIVRIRSGRTFVESKWGPFGVFLHTPASHTGSCAFYRSSRSGHALALLPISE